MRKSRAIGRLLAAIALGGCAGTAPADPFSVTDPSPAGEPEPAEELINKPSPVPIEAKREETDTCEEAPSESDAGIADADFEKHVEELRTRLPKGFKIFVERPFVVIGNESKQKVRQRAAGTVRWTVQRLRQDYFPKDPDHIIDIWLFRDCPTYRKYAMELFGDKPDTPYGYYSESSKAMVMNIATGGGTLVHEMVHPFMDANFPSCPAWVNEGLGSLYEQSSERDGHIWGLPNWRLDDLQKAIRRGKVPTFEFLMSQSRDDFYERDPGTNYAQSRYLLLYLQDQGLLVDFYHRFQAGQNTDPSGLETLRSVVGATDMEAFKKRWEAWVSKLSR